MGLHPFQLLKRLLLRRNKLFHVIPSRSRLKNVFEHVEGRKMSRCLFDLVDAGADLTAIDGDLSVPKAWLGARAEDRVLALHRSLLYVVLLTLFLLESVQKGSRFVRLGQVGKIRTCENTFIVDWCVFLGLELLNLQWCILHFELLIGSLAPARHRDDITQAHRIERSLWVRLCTFTFVNIWSVLVTDHLAVICHASHIDQAAAGVLGSCCSICCFLTTRLEMDLAWLVVLQPLFVQFRHHGGQDMLASE